MLEEPAPLSTLSEQSRERKLIRRLKNGEYGLFYELIRPHERRVFAAGFSVLRNEADAKDAVQEGYTPCVRCMKESVHA